MIGKSKEFSFLFIAAVGMSSQGPLNLPTLSLVRRLATKDFAPSPHVLLKGDSPLLLDLMSGAGSFGDSGGRAQGVGPTCAETSGGAPVAPGRPSPSPGTFLPRASEVGVSGQSARRGAACASRPPARASAVGQRWGGSSAARRR